MDILSLFYANESEREAVKEFLISVLGEIAIEKSFKREDVSGIADARDCIERSFDKLQELYGKKEKVVYDSSR